jgi:hypothetical protein
MALSLLALGAPPASACDWWWPCSDRPYAHRPAPRWYGYRAPWRGYGYRVPPWAYGFTSPARVYGDPYAAWPSTSIPQREWYLRTGLPTPNANAVGLTMPVATRLGLMEAGLPGKGPSLFGPTPLPPPVTGYYYTASPNGYLYNTPYYTPSYGAPPDTPSWWVEPRRRR